MARKNQMMSQESLAGFLSMNRSSIVNIEKGRQRPPLHLIWELSEILKVNIHDIIPEFETSDSSVKPLFEKKILKATEAFQENSKKKVSSFISRSSTN